MRAALAVLLVVLWAGIGPQVVTAKAAEATAAGEQLAQRTSRNRKGPGKPKNELRIAAVVNSEVITVRDLRTRLFFVLKTSRIPNRPEMRKRVSKQILRTLIEERLKMQEATRLGIKVSKKELSAAVGRLESNNKIPKGRLLPYFRRQGINPRTVIEQIQVAIAWRRVITRKIRPRVRISAEEVREYIARVSANQGQTRYRVSEIFLSVDTPDQESEVRSTAQRLFDQIKKGVSFARIANQFSQNPTARLGGDLGWIDQGSLSRALDTRLRQMKPGHVAGPIRTVGGYYIIALRETRVITLAPVKKPTVSLAQVVLKYPAKAKAADRKRLQARAAKISESASGCDNIEKLSKEHGASGTSRLKNVQLASLAPNLRGPARSLQVGKASKPIETKGGLTVIMVCARDAGSDRRRFQSVRRALGNRQLNILTRRYLRDLRRSAFLDVRV
jgi:peptidyl-prolyl cis-trans isomerase SurA